MSSLHRPKNALRAAALAAIAAVSVGACTTGLGANDYSRAQAGQVNRVDTGVVVASRNIIIEGSRSGLGASSGAVIGGVAGSQVGGGEDERIVMGIIGALAGGLIGAAAEERTSEQPGIEYTVRLDRNGQLITIAQAADVVLPANTPVFVQYGERARVVPQNSSVASGY